MKRKHLSLYGILLTVTLLAAMLAIAQDNTTGNISDTDDINDTDDLNDTDELNDTDDNETDVDDLNDTENETVEQTTTSTNQTNQSGQVTQANVEQFVQQSFFKSLFTEDMLQQFTEMFNTNGSIFVKEWYPKANHYVFVCNLEAADFTPTRFSWFYGDGEKQVDISNRDTYHIYQSGGNFTVLCFGTDGDRIRGASLDIFVMNASQQAAFNASANQTNQSTQTNQTVNQTGCFQQCQTICPVNQTTNQTELVEVCHATGSATNPFVEIEINNNSLAAHLGHGDIFPVPNEGCPGPNVTNATNQTNTTNVTTNVTQNATFEINLSGSEEAPPTNSTAAGDASVRLENGQLIVSGSFQNLSSALYVVGNSSAHVHQGIAGENGPVVFSLDVNAGSDNRSGFFTLPPVTLTQEQIQNLLNGSYYINVHTENFNGGEIRGQIE
ncbi:CHRD domain-containing protein [Candidatus Woesearchaeota archaeon]|nr:CHRD domain-containing protein [Candidatus Woesearchaeota archaeon]